MRLTSDGPCGHTTLTRSIVKDNNDLQERANILLVRMCGVIPPRSLIDPIIDAIFDAIKTSPVSLISDYKSKESLFDTFGLFIVLESTIESTSPTSK